MNTLNNQQINPGNRVDFSRIRRFAKGGVPKYQSAPGKLSYNWDWDGLNNAINGGGFGTATTTSLGYNKTFAPQGNIKTVADLERSQDYTDFTNYVKLNATTDPKVMEYLKNLDAKSRKAGSTTGHLFDANGNLIQGWENIYNDLRNDGMYGAYHYSANKLQPEDIVEDSSMEQPTNELPITTTSTQDFNTLLFLPKFQKSAPNTGYLHQIYRNNADSINKQLGYALQQQVPETTAAWQNATTSSNYLQALEAKKRIAENRANYQQQVNSTGDIAKANAAMLEYDTKATNPALAQIYQGMSDAITETTQNVENVGFANNQSEVQNSNNNIKNRIAGFNNRLNALSTAEAKINAEESSFLNNREAVIKEHVGQEKLEELLYNKKVNAIMASAEGLLAYKEYLNSAIDASAIADSSTGVTMQDIRNSLMENPDLFELSDEDLEILNDPMSELGDVIEIIRLHASALQDAGPVQEWLAAFNGYMKDADLRWKDAQYNISQKLAILDLGYRSHVSKTNDGVGVGTNWQTMYNSPLYKKGGKVEDRWSKYLQYRSKMNDTIQRSLNNTEKIAQTKLARDLDALDRETLLLLRSIFK